MKTNTTDLIQRGKQFSAKATQAYASYVAVKNFSSEAANTLAHTWKISEDWAFNLYLAAKNVAGTNFRQTPGIRQRFVDGVTNPTRDTFSSSDWAWTPIPGISPLIQARTAEPGVIEFRCARRKDLKALRRLVDEVRAEYDRKDQEFEVEMDFGPTHTSLFSWEDGFWDFRKDRRSRTFESVILPEETQGAIEGDLKAFSDSRERLERLELPWRRGYLLAGPPGTGKTSMSLAIAGSLGFKLCSLSLTDIESDGELRKAVSSLPRRSVLVIEDIDAYSVSHDRDHNTSRDGELSLSGILNSLDGFETPDGLVTVVTTNHIEKLDPALIRSGRLDRTFTLDCIEGTELERLFEWFYEEEPFTSAPENFKELGLTPADVTEIFKQHLDDAIGGWVAVMREYDPEFSLEGEATEQYVHHPSVAIAA